MRSPTGHIAAAENGEREINIRKEYLELIVEGVKTVEVSVGYPRMRAIQPGQELTFVSGDQRVPTTVKRVTEYPSFEEMLGREDARSIGGDLGESRENLLAAWQLSGAVSLAPTSPRFGRI